MGDRETRAALERHWSVSDPTDLMVHEIYHDDVVVEYPESGERIRVRASLRALRVAYPARLTFTIRRISDGKVAWETLYLGTPSSRRRGALNGSNGRSEHQARRARLRRGEADPAPERGSCKAKVGGRLRTKGTVGQAHEALCKVLCHNVCVVIQSMYELGIEATFCPADAAASLA